MSEFTRLRAQFDPERTIPREEVRLLRVPAPEYEAPEGTIPRADLDSMLVEKPGQRPAEANEVIAKEVSPSESVRTEATNEDASPNPLTRVTDPTPPGKGRSWRNLRGRSHPKAEAAPTKTEASS